MKNKTPETEFDKLLNINHKLDRSKYHLCMICPNKYVLHRYYSDSNKYFSDSNKPILSSDKGNTIEELDQYLKNNNGYIKEKKCKKRNTLTNILKSIIHNLV